MKVVFTERAETAIREIAFFIARDNKARARSFVRELQSKAQDIARMPKAFPLVSRYERYGIRRRVYGNYLIFYVVENETIQIVDIIHGAQDYEQILFPKD